MLRAIVGFHTDEEGDWVAELSCRHTRHVRHRPPFQVREWVTAASGRAGWQGRELDCPACDRSEPPAGLRLLRTIGPFDEQTIPAGLRRAHRLRGGTWGCLRVLAGAVEFFLHTEPATGRRVDAGDGQFIPGDRARSAGGRAGPVRRRPARLAWPPWNRR